MNFPVLGKIARQSFERCLGTVIGGWLGYAAYIVSQHPTAENWKQSWTTIISFVFAFAAFLVGLKLRLDYSAKLLGITFLLGKADSIGIEKLSSLVIPCQMHAKSCSDLHARPCPRVA